MVTSVLTHQDQETALDELLRPEPLAQGGEPARQAIDQADLGVSGQKLQQFLAKRCPHKNWLFSVFTSMFLHAGWIHIGGNMLFLWVFGNNVEDKIRPYGFLLFYLAAGIIAAVVQLALVHAGANDVLPNIGASGAIAGVLGAYLLMFPKARVVTLIPIIIFFTIRELPAIIVLGLWFVLQLFIGVESLGIPEAQNAGGVAYFAHIGGFAAGMILAALMGGLRKQVSVSGQT